MRNFYNQPTNKIFDKMFGKGARQIQADPATDLTKCKCCQCDPVECKGCISSHILTDQTGCCHSKNSGLVFEYERPPDFGAGMECCLETSPCCPEPPPSECGGNWDPNSPFPICRPPQECVDLEGNPLPQCSENPTGFRRCCGTGKLEASKVRFYYNYVGQYFKFQYGEAIAKTDKWWPNNGKPRLCSFCDPTSIGKSKGGTPSTPDEDGGKCLDYYGFVPGVGIVPRPIDDPIINQTPILSENQPCHHGDGDEIASFYGCQCMGVTTAFDYLLRDQNRVGTPMYDPFRHKKLSRYRKRQMEREPYYRWLADIMCYDGGNRVLNPVLEYYAPPGGEGVVGLEIPYFGNGTLFDHLLAVVHCEHWYELARCPQNPEHGDEGGILGGWIRDPITDERIGINTSIVAPRFWIYACSGVPLFDFEIADALNRQYISETDYEELMAAFAAELTPKQELLKKLAKGGYFDVGDWRQEALNEIEVLKGLSYTKDFYSGITTTPDLGACCIYAPPGATNGMNSTCFTTSGLTCGLCGGDFFLNRTCSSDLCVNCSGFKPHDISKPFDKYLGPVRKRLWVPDYYDSKRKFANPGGMGIIGLSGPARLDPKKARKNTISPTPSLARGEPLINRLTDRTLIDLQLPEDLIKEPWTIDGRNGTRKYPAEPPPTAFGNEPEYEEWRQFVIWRDSQWLYMHARPGGWDYVCSGFYKPPDEGGNPLGIPYTMPDLPRRYSTIPGWPGGCLAGLYGVPRETYEFSGGCPNDIQCGYTDSNENFIQYPLVGCEYNSSCLGIDCYSSEGCKFHPEKGGGATPCIGVAVSSSCDGMKWVRYKHKIVKNSNPNTQSCFSTYVTCAGDTITSYLYTVNKETGNFGSFCPHSCRNLSVPQRIAQSIPRIYSNRAAHEFLCEGKRNASYPGCGPYPGRICDGLYCNLSNVIDFIETPEGPLPENGYWYAPLFTLDNFCCGKKSGTPVGITAFGSPIHNAAACRRLPGPGYPGLYDGKFVGEAVDLNPLVCCWYCPPKDAPNPNPRCLGIKRYYECANEIDTLATENGEINLQTGTGVGFFYNPEDLPDLGICCQLSPSCGCATPAQRANLCPPIDSGDDNPPPPDGSGQ